MRPSASSPGGSSSTASRWRRRGPSASSCWPSSPAVASPSSACAASWRCSTRWPATSRRRARSSCARARGCGSSGCARPRSGWRSSTPRSGCWRATRPPPGTRSTTPRAWRARSAIACSWRRSASSARTSCSPRTASPRPPRRWRASTRGSRPTTSSGASSASTARGRLAAREGRARGGARGGPRRGRPGRLVGHVHLPRRRLARPGRGGRARGRGRGGGGRPRDGAAALSRQGQRRRRAPARALPPSPAARPSRWTAGARAGA